MKKILFTYLGIIGRENRWQSIVNKNVRSLKSGGNRRNQSRKTDYVSRFETRHDTTRSFDPRGKISAHTKGGKERRRGGGEEDAHDGMRAFRLYLCASAKWSVYTRFPPLLPLLLRCSTASRIVGHAAKSLGSAILYQRGRAQIDCQPYRLSFFVSPELFANAITFLNSFNKDSIRILQNFFSNSFYDI